VLAPPALPRQFRVAVEPASARTWRLRGKGRRDARRPRLWTASRQLRLQRVPSNGTAEIHDLSRTRRRPAGLCSAGGVDILKNGVPYASCRTLGKMILNLARWMSSVPGYVDNRISLAEYRTYTINHETGHQVGYNHELCPGPGKPAPVIQTQTHHHQGCTANPRPYLDGKRDVGPPAPP
jgi:hypothetical protein